MALNKAQLMQIPGGPGVTGAVINGNGILLDAPTGTISLDPTKVVTKLIAGSGVVLNPASGVGDVTIGFTVVADIPAGSKTVFAQATAPSGWVKDTSIDNAAIRITSSSGGATGGTQGFTTSFASYTPGGSLSASSFTVSGSVSSASLSTSQIPYHTHSYQGRECSPTGFQVISGGNIARCTQSTGGAGSSGGHTHSWSGSVTGSATFSGTPTSQFAVKYVDAILCTKS